MPVSDKMVKPILSLLKIYRTPTKIGMIEDVLPYEAAKSVQQVVNAAWTEFDPEVKSTWPLKCDSYLCEWNDSDVTFILQKVWDNDHWGDVVQKRIIRYADPQDLMYNNKGE